MSVRYFLEPNPVKPVSMRAVLLRGDKAGLDACLEHCEDASTVGQADALAVVQMMVGWIEQHAACGREVD